jgi:hypothetical protein
LNKLSDQSAHSADPSANRADLSSHGADPSANSADAYSYLKD